MILEQIKTSTELVGKGADHIENVTKINTNFTTIANAITNLDPSDGGDVTVTWADVTGKPTTFAPSTHSHAWGDVTGKPTTFVSAWADITGKPATFTPNTHTHAWADVTGKPSTFAPSAHTHLWADITDKPTTFTAATHTHAWADVTGKPSTFAPSTHSHAWADITSKPTNLPTVFGAAGALASPKVFVAAVDAVDGVWTVNYASASFTEVISVVVTPQATAEGGTVAGISTTAPTTTAASGFVYSLAATGLPDALTFPPATCKVYVTVYGR